MISSVYIIHICFLLALYLAVVAIISNILGPMLFLFEYIELPNDHNIMLCIIIIGLLLAKAIPTIYTIYINSILHILHFLGCRWYFENLGMLEDTSMIIWHPSTQKNLKIDMIYVGDANVFSVYFIQKIFILTSEWSSVPVSMVEIHCSSYDNGIIFQYIFDINLKNTDIEQLYKNLSLSNCKINIILRNEKFILFITFSEKQDVSISTINNKIAEILQPHYLKFCISSFGNFGLSIFEEGDKFIIGN